MFPEHLLRTSNHCWTLTMVLAWSTNKGNNMLIAKHSWKSFRWISVSLRGGGEDIVAAAKAHWENVLGLGGLGVVHGSFSWPDETFTSVTRGSLCRFLKGTVTWLSLSFWKSALGIQKNNNWCLLNVHYVPGTDGSQASAIILQDGY